MLMGEMHKKQCTQIVQDVCPKHCLTNAYDDKGLAFDCVTSRICGPATHSRVNLNASGSLEYAQTFTEE